MSSLDAECEAQQHNHILGDCNLGQPLSGALLTFHLLLVYVVLLDYANDNGLICDVSVVYFNMLKFGYTVGEPLHT